jgi:hypothetical protein
MTLNRFTERYCGWKQWRFKLPGGLVGVVDIEIPTDNYAEDAAFARYLARTQLNIKRLPAGTKVYPDYPPSRP